MRLRRTLKILFAAAFGAVVIALLLFLFLIYHWGQHDLKDPGEWTAATACMEAERKRDTLLSPNRADGYRTYASLLVSCDCKNLDLARKNLNAAFNLDGDPLQLVESTFTFLQTCRRCGDAITFINDFKGKLPLAVKATYLGLCYEDLGKPQEAIHEYSTAITDAEKSKVLTLDTIGMLYCERAQSDVEVGDQRKAVEDADRGKALGYRNYGRCE
jgi:tetratricopeptide (TPR) repeat protein